MPEHAVSISPWKGMSIQFHHQGSRINYSAAALSGAEVVRVDNQVVEHELIRDLPRNIQFIHRDTCYQIRVASNPNGKNSMHVALCLDDDEVDGFDLTFLPLKRVLFRRILLVMLLSVLIASGFASGLVPWWAALGAASLAAMLPLFGVRGRWLIERR